MKVIARGKEDGWYIVSVEGYPRNMHNPVYMGDGEKGVITSLANVSKRYWSEDELEDLRNKNVPVPDKIRKHITALTEKASKNQKDA